MSTRGIFFSLANGHIYHVRNSVFLANGKLFFQEYVKTFPYSLVFAFLPHFRRFSLLSVPRALSDAIHLQSHI